MQYRTSTDLQQNIYQNRSQFIKISKEAEKLKGEMRALRNLMSELKTNTTALRTASSQGPSVPNGFDTGFPSTLSKRDKRSSVADRTAMWNSQLQVGHTLCSADHMFRFRLTYHRRSGKLLRDPRNFYQLFQGDMLSRMQDCG